MEKHGIQNKCTTLFKHFHKASKPRGPSDPQLCCSNCPLQEAYKVTEEELVLHSLRALKICTRYFRGLQLPLTPFATDLFQRSRGILRTPTSRANDSYGEAARTSAELQAPPAWLLGQDPPAAAGPPGLSHRQELCQDRPTSQGWDLCPHTAHTHSCSKRNAELKPSL